MCLAVSPADYIPLSELLSIPDCEHKVCVNVTVNDDNIMEDTEAFLILLERSPSLPLPGIRLNTSQAEITLLDSDDDSKYVIVVYPEFGL